MDTIKKDNDLQKMKKRLKLKEKSAIAWDALYYLPGCIYDYDFLAFNKEFSWKVLPVSLGLENLKSKLE